LGDAEGLRSERNARWIEAHCRVPEGKFVGRPVKLTDEQRRWLVEIYDTPTRSFILSMARKNAKALALDTPVPTPQGWRVIGEIRQGDQVFGSNGEPCTVLAESEVFVGKPCYRVSFSDGQHIVASGDHVWTFRNRWTGKPYDITTSNLASTVADRHGLDVAGPVQFQERQLPIPPYVLGAWLGDGTTKCASFTCSEDDLPHFASHLGAELGCPVTVARYENRAPTLRASGSGLQATLRADGLLGNKHIPEAYFAGSVEQRWALLQGLMDTDGSVNIGPNTPRCSFTNTNIALALGVWRLVRSLGMKATVRESHASLRGADMGPVWRVSFTARRDERVFRLPRKQSLLPVSIGKRSRRLMVTACSPVESVPTKCLAVNSADHLFLVGHGCIPTHNTAFAAFLLLLHLCGPEAKANSQLYSAAQSRDQAAVLFALAAKMVRMSPDLHAYVAIRDTAKELGCPELGTLYKALSADAPTAHGKSPAFLVHDELGQVRGPRSELHEALETACSAHESPLSVVISTQAPTDGDLLSILIDDALKGEDPRTKVVLYAAPDSADPFADESIRLANPHFDHFMNQAEVFRQRDNAKRMPSSEAAYRNLILNQRIDTRSPFISRASWLACAGAPDPEAFAQGPVYGGLDLSARNDLVAAAKVAKKDGLWHGQVMFFAPESGIRERSMRDRAPYDVWAAQGYIILTPGVSIRYEDVAKWLVEECDAQPVVEIAFDRWRIDVLKTEIERLGVELPLVPFGQGFKDMTPALDELETAVLNETLRHGGNPVLTWCAANAIAVSDPAGNRKLDKSKSTGRIDGLQALAMALGRAAVAEKQDDLSGWLSNPVKG
jgi:phage terminase large subunit-like protein